MNDEIRPPAGGDDDEHRTVMFAELEVARASLRFVPEQEAPFVRERIVELREQLGLAKPRLGPEGGIGL